MLTLDEEPVVYPWNAVKNRITAGDYLRKSRYFLEFGGFLDPKLMHHKRGPGFVEKERNEIRSAMLEFVSNACKEPRQARAVVIGFIEKREGDVTRRMERVTDGWRARCITGIGVAYQEMISIRTRPPTPE